MLVRAVARVRASVCVCVRARASPPLLSRMPAACWRARRYGRGILFMCRVRLCVRRGALLVAMRDRGSHTGSPSQPSGGASRSSKEGTKGLIRWVRARVRGHGRVRRGSPKG
jgi:hypothetical protein